MPLTIQPELEAKLRQRAEAAGISVESWLERVAIDDEDADAAIAELRELAMEGIESGESIIVDDAFIAQQRQMILDRHQSKLR